MVGGILIIGGIVLIGVVASAIDALWHRGGTNRAERRIRRDVALAHAQLDDLVVQARIRMEEAVGWRRPGEQRIGDGIRGSWRRW